MCGRRLSLGSRSLVFGLLLLCLACGQLFASSLTEQETIEKYLNTIESETIALKSQLTESSLQLEISKQALKTSESQREKLQLELNLLRTESESQKTMLTTFSTQLKESESSLLKMKRINKWCYPIVGVLSFVCGGFLVYTLSR